MKNNELMVKDFEGANIRIIVDEKNEPWFVAKDICDVLGINKYRDAVSRLDDDERGSVIVDTLGGPQKVAAINEPGLYGLILVSRKPEAKRFKRWVKHEVLPSIRKHGGYVMGQEQINDPEVFLSKALLFAKSKMDEMVSAPVLKVPKVPR